MVSKAELSKLKPSERWLRKVAAECHEALQWILTGQEDEHQSVDQDIDQIGAFLRKKEIARIAVMEAIKTEDDGIWIRLEQLVREQQD